MSRASKALTVVVVAALGIWGCAQGSNGDNAERIRQLENDCKVAKADYHAVADARNRLREQVASLETERAQMQKEAEAHLALIKDHQTLTKERDELIQQVGARTTERDVVQGQLEQVRKGLRNLLGQTEAAIGAPPVPTASAGAAGSGGKS
jgi:uncharacterized coiled-coil DUF342 family protein